MAGETRASNFVREIVEAHNREGRFRGKVITRFPPEPNGIGGGMLRDVLVREIPTVLREDLYAVAALAGAAVVVAGHLIQLPPTAATISGAALCFGIRLVAIRRGWSLPTAN